MHGRTRRNAAALLLAVCVMLSACGCSKTKDKAQDSRKEYRDARASAALTSQRTKRSTSQEKPSAEDIVRQLAQEPQAEKADELRNRLAKIFPGCVPDLLRIASDENHPNSYHALQYLSWEGLGEHEQQVRSLIVKELDDKDRLRRSAALFVLYSHDWPEATDGRLATVWRKDPDALVRGQALECVPKRPELTGALWKILLEGVTDANEDVRDSACWALEELEDRIQPFHGDLPGVYTHSRDPDVRMAILKGMARCKLGAKDAPLLKNIMAGPPSAEQLAALEAMLALPAETPGMLDAALPALKQMQYYDLRRAAVAAIAHQRPVTDRQLGVLLDTASNHTCQITRNAAMEGMGDIGPEAGKVAARLASLYPKLRADHSQLIWTLYRIAPAHPLVGRTLRDALRKGELGFHERHILQALDDKSFAAYSEAFLSYVRSKAKKEPVGFFLSELCKYRQVSSLESKQKQELAKVVATMLDTTSKINDRGHACKVLQMLGKDAVVALPQVRTVLRVENPFGFEVHHALHAVGRMGVKAGAAETEVRKLLGNQRFRSLAAAVMIRLSPANTDRMLSILREELHADPTSRKADALQAAACLGPAAKPLSTEIEPIANDPSSAQQVFALVAVGTIGDSAPVIRQLIAKLQSDDEQERFGACRALVLLQKFARQAVPTLREMMRRDPDNSIYYAGAIYEITGRRVRPIIWGFNNVPGGYPW